MSRIAVDLLDIFEILGRNEAVFKRKIEEYRNQDREFICNRKLSS